MRQPSSWSGRPRRMMRCATSCGGVAMSKQGGLRVDPRHDLSSPPAAGAKVLASHRVVRVQSRAGGMGAGRACRIRQGTSAASGGSLPNGATIPSNSGSSDAPEDGGAAIRKGGPPPSYVVGRRGRIQYKQMSEALPPRTLLSCTIRLRFAEPVNGAWMGTRCPTSPSRDIPRAGNGSRPCRTGRARD